MGRVPVIRFIGCKRGKIVFFERVFHVQVHLCREPSLVCYGLNFTSVLQFGEQQRLYLVENFAMSQEDSSGAGDRYVATINGMVYVLVDPSAPPPAPTPPEPTQAPTNTEG